MKEATSVNKVPIIGIIKPGWGKVKGCQICVTTTSRASCPSSGCKAWVNIVLVVNSISEKIALSLAYRVCTGKYGHFPGGEAFGGEHGD